MKKKFVRKIDKSEIPICSILGVNIAAIDMEYLIEYIKRNLEKLSGDYITVANVHTTVTAYENPDYMKIQNDAVMAIPDGGPLSSLAHRRGYPEMKRVTGPDLMGEIFEISVENGYSHFFYGSTQKTLDKLKAELEKKYPGINIKGMYSPPFRALTEEEDEEIIQMLNDVDADFVWVGLGAPKQENWMAQHVGKIPGFMAGVGAGFDYYAGNIKRAPAWMQSHDLEWLYRLYQDPKKLFKRYFNTNFKFLWLGYVRGK